MRNMPSAKFKNKTNEIAPEKSVLKSRARPGKNLKPAKISVAKKSLAEIFSYIKTLTEKAEKTPAVLIEPSPLKTFSSNFVAPTTPFIPKYLLPIKKNAPLKTAAIALSPKPLSEHIVDLRAITTISKKAKPTKRQPFAYAEPRIISHRRVRFSWQNSLPVAFAKFIAALSKKTVVGLGKALVAPVTIGLRLVENIDLDRKKDILVTSLVAKKETAAPEKISKETEPIIVSARPFNLRRAILSFATVSMAVVLPMEGMNLYRSLSDVKNKAESAGISGLVIADVAKNGILPDPTTIEAARIAFADAGLAVAKVGFWENTIIDAIPVIGEKFRSGKELISAGEKLLKAAASLNDLAAALSLKSEDVTQKISELEKIAAAAEPNLGGAVNDLLKIKAIPSQISKENFNHNLSLLIAADNSLKSFLNLAPSLYQILGKDSTKRYLVIFQNNAELRPTGGFMGSFALLDVDRGRITKIEVPAGGPYDLQGSLKASVLAPDPLRLVNARWQFQDANWFPDFPTSAQKIIWFYNKAGGPSVDGVIALNAPVLAKLVDAVGPIDMPAYGQTVTSDTVLKITQEIVESNTARASGKPKQFIADLLPKVLDKVMTSDRDTLLSAVSIFGDSLALKDIQIYMRDGDIQKKISEMNWSGELAPLPAKTDFFELVRSNIAGQKTDAVIATTISHRSNIADDGTITDTVTITLNHNGKKNEPMTGVRNVEYLRVYVPEGSELVSDSGDINAPSYKLFDTPPAGCIPDQTLADVTGAVFHDQTTGVAINNEFRRTVFGAWTQTDPGESSTITFVYNLPWKAVPARAVASLSKKLIFASEPVGSFTHNIIFARQSGANETKVTASLSLPLSWYPLFASPEGMATSNGYQTTFELNGDKKLSLSAVAPADKQ